MHDIGMYGRPQSVTMTLPRRAIVAAMQRWNALIPKCAIDVHDLGTHIRYRHPKKGWRVVSKRRLGLQAG